MLLNKNVEKEFTSFTVWADMVSQICSFLKKVVSVKGVPEDLKYQHDIGRGYWVNITVSTESFDKVIADIKNVFENDKELLLCEDFNQKDWAADMLFAG